MKTKISEIKTAQLLISLAFLDKLWWEYDILSIVASMLEFNNSTINKIKILPTIKSFSTNIVGKIKAIGKKKILNNNSCLNALSSKANLNPEKLLIVAKYSLLIPLFFLAEVAFWFFFSVFCKFYSNILAIIY